MAVKMTTPEFIDGFLKTAAGYDSETGNPRVKEIIHRLLVDVNLMMDDLAITPEEFWVAVYYLGRLGTAGEPALLAAGLGLERMLDMRQDAEDEAAGRLDKNATPRIIEGPLYVAGAPVCEGEGRMDDGTDLEASEMYLHGKVFDADGQVIPNAMVEVWHADSKGGYSYFDPTQSEYNLRRKINVSEDGCYVARSIVPSGYGVPPEGPTNELLSAIGRHGNRPAHIHFFVSAPGYAHLTTQINLDGDPYLHDDFAFATRDELIAQAIRVDQPEEIKAKNMSRDHFYDVEYNFVLAKAKEEVQEDRIARQRALA
ncbi:MAG: catechol 1,2-dioxygenase [Neisseriaceae bacterium]|nr:catechol 1,2-dioxygenase [Neisseriaceae bacterium]